MGGRQRRVTIAVLAVYLVALARVTLWPRIGADDAFDVVHNTVTWISARSVPLTYDMVEFAANIVLFVPLGILVSLLAPHRPAWAVVCLGLATSAVIELSQLLFLPDRVADVRDVVANTLGTALGVALLRAAGRRSRIRRPAATAAG